MNADWGVVRGDGARAEVRLQRYERTVVCVLRRYPPLIAVKYFGWLR